MTPQQIDLIRASFAKVLYQKEAAGRLFYERLFEIAPEVRTLFKTDITVQAGKLMDTLAVAVGALRDTPGLKATLQALGRRHDSYGAEPRHYAKVGEALLWTLEKGLGPAFDADTRAAWTALYGMVATTMQARRAQDERLPAH